MKKIFKYLGIVLSVVLMGAFTACQVEQENGSADLGLGIKVFFPTKVVAGQPMTINGSGFSGVREIVFPDGVSVTSFELVSDEMIRVVAPAGISAKGGKLILNSADDHVESRVPLTLGQTVISGFSKQEGESIEGGEQLTIYGEDLEFITGMEILDPDGNPLLIKDISFYRKGTNTVVVTLPKKIYEGVYVGKLFTVDGREFSLPELEYKPASNGGQWVKVKTTIWKNDDPEGHGPANWNGTYRFAGEGFETGEEIAIIPADQWAQMKSGKFYMLAQGSDWVQMRITTGWWSVTWTGDDICTGNERIIDNEDGTYSIEIDFTGEDNLLSLLDEQHLLLTGSGFTPLELYFEEEKWQEGGGHWEIIKTPIWNNDDPDGHGPANWNGTYRFAGEGFETGEEIAIIPADQWAQMKSGKFYMRAQGSDWVQMRITTGWWSVTWTGDDICTGNERIIDNEDGTYSIEIDFTGEDNLLSLLDEQHLLLTGSGFTPLELYFQEEKWVEGGGPGSAPNIVPFWVNDDPEGHGPASWNGTYRFALTGHDDNSESIAELPQDVWDKIKTGTFYVEFQPVDDWYQVRITNGWWDSQWQGSDNDFSPNNMSDRIIDNGDGTFYIEINFGDDPIVGTLDQKHLLFTGSGYVPLKLYFLE